MTLAAVMFGAMGLLVLTVLVLDLTGVWRRGAYFRWQAAGLLLVLGAVEARGIAQLRGWPSSGHYALFQDPFPFIMVGIVLVVVGGIGQSRARRSRK